MPPYKPRTKPPHLTKMEFLNVRMTLSPKEMRDLTKWQKGYDGELHFDQLTQPFESDTYLLQDLVLKSHSTTFQIDTFMISPEKNYLFEIKNHEGDYIYDDNTFFRLPNTEILNPLHQLQRAETLLFQLLKQHGISTPIESYLIFTNPQFTLYQAPINPSIIHPTQLPAFIDKIRPSAPSLNTHHEKLAKTLHSLHNATSSSPDMPTYSFDTLRKGIYCLQCLSFAISLRGQYCYCEQCRHGEPFSAAVLRNAHEFKQLFPTDHMTTRAIHKWCGEHGTIRRIRSVLDNHFVKKGSNHGSHYE